MMHVLNFVWATDGVLTIIFGKKEELIVSIVGETINHNIYADLISIAKLIYWTHKIK